MAVIACYRDFVSRAGEGEGDHKHLMTRIDIFKPTL